MSLTLRPYQRAAIDALYAAMRASAAPTLVVLPTGSGKSAVISTVAREAVTNWNGRVLVVSHVRELIEQMAQTLHRIWGGPLGKAPVGVYSAGLKRRDTTEPVICAGIQSIYSKACDLGRFDLILVDEAHLIPTDGEGMYRRLLADLRVINPNARLAGFTATDFRLDCGYIHGEGKLFESVCYEAGVRDLIEQGFLCRLRGKDGGCPDLTSVHLRGGEYIAGELEAVMADGDKVDAACAEIVKYGEKRNAWLVFCCGVRHAGMVSDALRKRGVDAPVIVGDTPSDERAELIRRYKGQELRCLVSVGVLTTGFDAPHVDLIALLRPTQSAGLYCQMVGRGLRLHPSKTDCMVLDLAGVISEHGPVDAIEIREKGKAKSNGDAPTKTCPQCQEILPAAAVQCSGCGFIFPREVARHDHKAADVSPLVEYKEEIHEVTGWDWRLHTKKGAVETAPKTLRVDYDYGYHQIAREWLCFEHSGFARTKAEAWWEEVTGQDGFMAPCVSLEALDKLDALRNAGSLRRPARIRMKTGGKWPELIGREYDREPGADESEPVQQTASPSDDEIPF